MTPKEQLTEEEKIQLQEAIYKQFNDRTIGSGFLTRFVEALLAKKLEEQRVEYNKIILKEARLAYDEAMNNVDLEATSEEYVKQVEEDKRKYFKKLKSEYKAN